MDEKRPFYEMLRRVKEKNFDQATSENIALRVITDERSRELIQFMDKNPNADEIALLDEACRLQKKYPRPPRKKPE